MAELINKKYKVTATILTPLHIGAGSEKDWVRGVDYIEKDRILWHLDMQKMLAADIDVNRMAQMYASGKEADVVSLVGSKLQTVSDFYMPMPCSTTNPVKVFLRNQLTGRPVLAGSSLKGAIRSVLFTYLRDKNETTNNAVFGNLNDSSDFMRFIRVGDIEFPADSTELVNTKIFNLEGGQGHWSGGWKHGPNESSDIFQETGFNTIYECLPVGEKAEGCIMIADELFNMFVTRNKEQNVPKAINHENKKSVVLNQPIQYLCNIINAHTRKYIEKEKAFFSHFSQAEYSDYLYADEDDFSGATTLMLGELDDLEKNQCVIKMSAGAGFHFITGDWQYDDYYSGTLDQKRNRQGAKPKSRKIAITYDGDNMFLDLMGFVKLTFEKC